MKTSTISPKYQVVIPKEIRRKLNMQPGQKVYFRERKDGTISLQTVSIVESLAGSMKGAWGPDPDAYLRGLRSEANRDRS